MTKARKDGRCSYDSIVDRSRPVYAPNVWDDPGGYDETVRTGYRKDYWYDQPEYVELWVEKDAVIGSIHDLCDGLGVTVRVSRGFLSTTRARDIAQILYSIHKPKTIFYLGDHDPSGSDVQGGIQHDAVARIQQHVCDICRHDAENEVCYDHLYLEVDRLAIHPEDIETFNLPPLRVKTNDAGDYTDTRAKKFIAEYGHECVELDALPPTELRRRIKEAVESKLDVEKWNRAIAVEQVELQNMHDTVGKWREKMLGR